MKRISLIVLTVLMFLATFATPRDVSAETLENWSWTRAKPVIYSSKTVSSMDTFMCQTSYQTKVMDGFSDSQKICITSGKNLSFGVTSYNSVSPFSYAVSFKYDSKWYRINSPCYRYDGCIYLPETDTLVSRQYLVNNISRSLVIYKNFSHRLTQINNGDYISYNFDSSNPDYVFRAEDGYAWPVGGVGASSDGKWLGIEFKQRGIGLLDLETFEMKRISTLSFTYGQGYDPVTEIAISDGGKQVAIMGVNAYFTIIENDGNCGDSPNDTKMYNVHPIENPCKTADANPHILFDGFYSALGPRFNSIGSELNFYVTFRNHEVREVTMHVAGYVGQRMDYLALGDSYSSGEGETDDKYYLPWTNEKYEKCHLSSRSYPYLLAKLSNIDSKYMRSVACSGAKTDDVIGNYSAYMGQGGRLESKGLGIDSVEAVVEKTYARINFIPGRIPQEEFVDFYKPKVITVGIGGNDAGLVDKLKACVSPVTCSWASDLKKREQTMYEISVTYNKLISVYKKLHADSPEAKIYAIGYPKIIEENEACLFKSNASLNSTERKLINESILYLNKVVERAAKAAGVMYVDIYDSFGKKVLCGISDSVVNDIRSGEDINPVGDSDNFTIIGNESFHPKPSGNKLMAESITKKVGNILSYEYCSNGEVVCPDQTVTAPDPDNSSYWMSGKSHSYTIHAQKAIKYIFSCDESCGILDKQINFDAFSFEPSSNIRVEIQSTPRDIGSFVANSDGSLNAIIKLPSDLEEGFHTIWLYGTTYSGEPIDLYQVIQYIKDDEKLESSELANSISQKANKQKSYAKSTRLISNTNYDVANNNSTTSPSSPEVKGERSVVVASRSARKELNRGDYSYWKLAAGVGLLIITGLIVYAYIFNFKLNKNKF